MKVTKPYDIKNAAQHLGIAPSTLRYWEREGLVRADRNQENDYRQYSVHDLIDASEIAFYRKLGVSVKELRSYRALSVAALDNTLERTAYNIDQRIIELELMRERLIYQRTLNDRAKTLMEAGMCPSKPAINQLSAIDYDDSRLWHLLVNEPWRYGVIIEASHPETRREAVVDAHPSPTNVIWTHDKNEEASLALECLLLVDPDGDKTNARELFCQAKKNGFEPSCVVGNYLLTASSDEDSLRWDFYHAWIVS